MSETTETGPVRPRFEVRKAPETKAIRDAMRRHHHGEGNSCDWCTEVAVRLIEEVVDPLVTEAERRGAQAEGEQIAKAFTLLEDAVFLRMYDERPPGHEGVTWPDWERRAEQFLRQEAGVVSGPGLGRT